MGNVGTIRELTYSKEKEVRVVRCRIAYCTVFSLLYKLEISKLYMISNDIIIIKRIS